MLFNSFSFLVFLPLVFGLYWFVFNRSVRLQNFFLLVASYVFYGWWDWRFLILIAITSLSSWASGLGIHFFREREQARGAKGVLVANLLVNLGILGFFKYFNFFVGTCIAAFAGMGITLHGPALHILLPVGISFYTFQAIGYSVDVYRGTVKSTRDVVAFFAFVSFFPQLVAGPIERAANLLPQFFKPRVFDYDKAADGVRQMLWGFFKKLVIADNCAGYVQAAFDNSTAQTPATLWLALFLFAIQVYCDFSGYSDIAIGSGRLFGFSLMRNFNYPFFSRNVAELWRRWHISLSTWFRDYVYFPLGGSRGGKWKTIRNTFIVFAIIGLWHGATWTFVLWGCYCAVWFVPRILSRGRQETFSDIPAEGRLLPGWREGGRMAGTFLIFMMGLVIFRSQDLVGAWHYLQGMCGVSFPPPVVATSPALSDATLQRAFFAVGLGSVLLLMLEWGNRSRQYGLQLPLRIPRPLRWGVYMLLLCIIGLYTSTNETPFVYFQF